MELRLLEKDKDGLRIEIRDPDETILYPLVHELLQDKAVLEARCMTGHPQLDLPVLLVRVDDGKPQAALKKAAQSLADQFGETRALIEKALK